MRYQVLLSEQETSKKTTSCGKHYNIEVFLPAEARAARERLVLRLLYVFRVCLFVVRPHLSRAQYVTSYATMQLQYNIAAFGSLHAKLQQTKVVVSCLDGENLVDSRKYPVLVAYSY